MLVIEALASMLMLAEVSFAADQVPSLNAPEFQGCAIKSSNVRTETRIVGGGKTIQFHKVRWECPRVNGYPEDRDSLFVQNDTSSTLLEACHSEENCDWNISEAIAISTETSPGFVISRHWQDNIDGDSAGATQEVYLARTGTTTWLHWSLPISQDLTGEVPGTAASDFIVEQSSQGFRFVVSQSWDESPPYYENSVSIRYKTYIYLKAGLPSSSESWLLEGTVGISSAIDAFGGFETARPAFRWKARSNLKLSNCKTGKMGNRWLLTDGVKVGWVPDKSIFSGDLCGLRTGG